MKINGFISTVMLTVLLLIAALGGITHAENEEDWMPDPHLQRAVHQKLQIPDGIPIHPADMAALTHLVAEHDIERLKGLEYAINLEFLHIGRTEVSDLTPLAGLVNLHTLKLFNNHISDISPLTGLIGLRHLQLQNNFISDLTPLVSLTNLETLSIYGNPKVSDLTPLAGLVNLHTLKLFNNHISDISPLTGLIGLRHLQLQNNFISDLTPLVSLTNLETLSIYGNPNPLENQFTGIEDSYLKALIDAPTCNILRPIYTGPVTQRLNNRDYPSVFLTHKRSNFNDDSDPFHQLIQYDFSFMFEPFHPLVSLYTTNSPFGGMVRTMESGSIPITEFLQVHREAIRENPNMIFIVEIAYFDGRFFNLPEDSLYWFRNPDGSIARRLWKVDHLGNKYSEPLLNFTHPDVIEMIIQQTVAIAKCGLYDGIWLDRWHPDFHGELSHLVTPEDERNARLQILQGIRAHVREDFLIMVNSRQEFPHFAPYINGVFIEAHEPKPNYTHKDLYHFENIIKWYESNLRKPSFTLLWGQVDHKPPKSQRRVRMFTTLSLTHSDGYVSVSSGHPDIRTLWYDFWDADLGRPVGGDETKAQLYEDREGLFIREFTNGWAVYNRSGDLQTVQLPEQATGVESGISNTLHILPDLDGEIYLKSESGLETPPTTDVNADGIVNILDLVAVANAFGKEAPDVNGDGTVNVLDLVAVANAFE